MRARLTVGPDEAVALPAREAEALGVRHGDEVELTAVRGAFALVASPSRDATWFAGALGALSFAEVAGLVAATRRSGLLLVSSGGAADAAAGPGALRRRTLSFRDGQVVFASSSDPADRLGPVLWRSGMLPLADLERAAGLVGAGRPLGKVLVELGLLTPAQVYEGIVRQVREIVLGCCACGEGEFVFRAGAQDDRNAVRLPERTSELLRVGLQRAEELEVLRAGDVPDLSAPLRAVAGAAPRELDSCAARLLGCADGRPLAAALADAQLGAYDGVRAAATLAREGLVEAWAGRVPVAAATAPGTPPAAASAVAGSSAGAFEHHRALLAHVFFALRAAVPDARERLNGYLERLPEAERALFHGVRLDGEGNLDGARVLLNVKAAEPLGGAAARARALAALEDFLAFALFEARNVLPAREAEALRREAEGGK